MINRDRAPPQHIFRILRRIDLHRACLAECFGIVCKDPADADEDPRKTGGDRANGIVARSDVLVHRWRIAREAQEERKGCPRSADEAKALHLDMYEEVAV